MKKRLAGLVFLLHSGLICVEAQDINFSAASKQETIDWILNTTILHGETVETGGASTCSRKGNTLIRTWLVNTDTVRDEFDFNKYTGYIETSIPGAHFFLYCTANSHKKGDNTLNGAMQFDIRGNESLHRQFAMAFEHLKSLSK